MLAAQLAYLANERGASQVHLSEYSTGSFGIADVPEQGLLHSLQASVQSLGPRTLVTRYFSVQAPVKVVHGRQETVLNTVHSILPSIRSDPRFDEVVALVSPDSTI
jgi:hypothetical protein